ncbi:MAG: thiamine phosphate synthase [Gemmataceae bacterium]|nr:thiamine phosphate synthase [Gemmataceae bacterium]
MKTEFSPGLALALRLACRLAAKEGVEEIGPSHLLRALLADDEGHGAGLLRRMGMDLERWKDRAGADAFEATADASLPLAGSTKLILNRAGQERSLQSQDSTTTSDQALCALLRLSESLRDELTGFGFDYRRLLSEVEPDHPHLPLDQPLQLDEDDDVAHAKRILDAAANRAREALRVLEDYCRFVLDDRMLTEELKGMRHGLAQALRPLPWSQLLESRDTQRDVGTQVTGSLESRRESLAVVMTANAKRLQEALRSLEEFGKVFDGGIGSAVEALRYRAYVMEQTIAKRARGAGRLADALLYVLVTESLCKHSLIGTVREAIEGGADVIQLREKNLSDRELLAKARDVGRLCRDHGKLFIVNDRPDIAMLAEADGVHLGQDDLPLREARRIMGNKIIGISSHDLPQLREAALDGADYVGIGPTFPSKTKDFQDFAGLAFVEAACRETSLPAFVLGGVSLDRLDEVIASGGRRIAVSHAICAADDPRRAAAELRKKLLSITGPYPEAAHSHRSKNG